MVKNVAIDKYIVKCEQEVLTTILTTPAVVDICVSSIEPTDFIDEKNRAIYRVIYDLHISTKQVTKNIIADFIANNEEYKFDNWQSYLDELAMGFSYDEDLRANLEIIKNASIKRQLDAFSHHVIDTKIDFAKYNNQIFELQKQFMDIIDSKKTSQLANMETVTRDYMNHLGILRERNEDITGTPVGFKTIDKVTNGFQPQDLIILAARPGVGKTAIALNFINRAAKEIKRQGREKTDKVVIFSLEMGKDQLCQRLISMNSNVESNSLRSGKMSDIDWESVKSASIELESLPILIDDKSDENIIDIQSKLKQLKNNGTNIKLVVIDYIQLMHGPRVKGAQVNRQQEISTISRMLKLLARQIEAPIIGLAQLSRAVESAPGERPQLSHLRESGALEQDADIVCFLYKQKDETEEVATAPDLKPATFKQQDSTSRIEFIIAKHRNGELKTIPLSFDAKYGVFHEYTIKEESTNETKKSIIN